MALWPGHTFNDFFPWMINEDGTEEETVNHLGRHEFNGYFDRSLTDDPNLTYHSTATPRTNPNVIENFLQIKEDPAVPGTYYGIDAPEFSTHASGQTVKFNAPVGFNPDLTIVTYVTHRDTHTYTDTPSPNHSGLYRNPLPLSNGTVVTVHTSETRNDINTGTRENPGSRYALRLRTLTLSGSVYVAGATLTPGISKSVTWYDPDVLVTYSGPLWELDPVEVRARTRPSHSGTPLSAPVQQVFAQQSVSVSTLQAYLRQQGLALIVSNNVTTRDRNDQQQPFNLRVAGTSTQTLGAGGKIYDISHLQIFQADQIRGLGGTSDPSDGRRIIAQYLHDPAVMNPPVNGAPRASVSIASDGSVAAFGARPSSAVVAIARSGRHAGRARTLLGDDAAGRDPGVHVVPRDQYARSGESIAAGESARSAASAADVLESDAGCAVRFYPDSVAELDDASLKLRGVRSRATTTTSCGTSDRTSRPAISTTSRTADS